MFSNPLDSVFFVLLLSVVAGLISIIIHSWLWPKAKKIKPEYHLDALSMSIIERATLLLPSNEREMRREEWYAHLVDIGSPTERLLHSAGCYRAALTIRSEEYILAPIGNAVSLGKAFLDGKAKQVKNFLYFVKFAMRLTIEIDWIKFWMDALRGTRGSPSDFRSFRISSAFTFILVGSLGILVGSLEMLSEALAYIIAHIP